MRRRFRTAVSLHSHTLHSKEALSFVWRVQKRFPLAARLLPPPLRHASIDSENDLARGWWTSPLSARQAFELEAGQIETMLNLQALVSISDHDDIEAPSQLRLLNQARPVPISVEWTMPVGPTYFHIGVHNLPVASCREWMTDFQEYTKDPRPQRLAELLRELHGIPEVLIVFNHPMWDLAWLGGPVYTHCVQQFLGEFRGCIHALELNGLRSWKENRRVVELAKSWDLPLISGGDRHGREPNALLNLTQANTFEEFVEEVRQGALSHVLVMPQYEEPIRLRVLQTLRDILRDDPEHSLGWRKWSDRVFCPRKDGTVASFTELLGGREPRMLKQLLWLVGLAVSRPLRPALNLALAEGQEVAL